MTRLGRALGRLRGRDVPPPTYAVSTWLFLRLLGLVHLLAFLSMWVQVKGLVGERGILPLAPFLDAVHERLGPRAVAALPTLFWLDASDGALVGACALGVVLSLLLLAGVAQVPALVGLWALYLSIVTGGREFLTFQWDHLLLEATFLAVFLAPLTLRPGRARGFEPPPLSRWLLWWLVFRLNFMSGVVKLLSQDPTWRDLSALQVHFFTQPLPTWIGWFAHQVPPWILTVACAGMFAIELLAPFLVFAPRRVRHAGCAAMISLQAGIALTGNYGFFNLLTTALCLLLVDDTAWPRQVRARLAGSAEPPAVPRRIARRWPRWALVPVAVLAVVMTTVAMLDRFRLEVAWPSPVRAVRRAVAPFGTFNAYGLFAAMTTVRPEIVVEGSVDGVTWKAYEFRWKPGDPARRPRFVAPHMPRLDWRMWFAALGDHRHSPWFGSFVSALAEGSPEVHALLATNPFPDGPPRFLRATLHDYRFTDPKTRRATGNWWRRTEVGAFAPVVVRPAAPAGGGSPPPSGTPR